MAHIVCITPTYIQKKLKVREHLLRYARNAMSEIELRQVVLFNFDITQNPDGSDKVTIHAT